MSTTDHLLAYGNEIAKQLATKKSTEHTFRKALQDLIESFATDIIATNEPKRIECGAPDYVVARKRRHGHVTIGYIEAKDIGADLDHAIKSEQLHRYLNSLDNLILTDYIEFRWFTGGKHRLSVRLDGGEGGKGVIDEGGRSSLS